MAVRRKPTARSPFDSTYSIGSTHAEAVQHNDAAVWNYDPPTGTASRCRDHTSIPV
jgi:hypothetical protein